MSSKIEWTEETWNPLAGCSLASEGCRNCYAMRMAARLAAMGQEKYVGTTKKVNGRAVWTGVINLDEKALRVPLERKKPTMWFVNSMSDLFHEDVPDEFIDKVFAVMALCPQHTFQVLTKRAGRMSGYFAVRSKNKHIVDQAYEMACSSEELGNAFIVAQMSESLSVPFKNVWLGASAEDQENYERRVLSLRRVPAAVRFLSLEPLLGPIDLFSAAAAGREANALDCRRPPQAFIDWVIVGGESGPGARAMHPDWVRGIRDQCVSAGVKFFFKQWGAWCLGDHVDLRTVKREEDMIWMNEAGEFSEYLPELRRAGKAGSWSLMSRLGKKAAGRVLDGRVWDEMPEGAR